MRHIRGLPRRPPLALHTHTGPAQPIILAQPLRRRTACAALPAATSSCSAGSQLSPNARSLSAYQATRPTQRAANFSCQRANCGRAAVCLSVLEHAPLLLCMESAVQKFSVQHKS